MINKYKEKLENRGVSPVIGVILLVAVTVALVALATVIVFNIGDNVSESTDATINIQETSNGITIEIIRNNNVDTLLVNGPNGFTDEFDADIGQIHTINEGSGSYTVVAVLDDGSEQTVESTSISEGSETESETATGTASVNPAIEGATVEALDSNGNVLESTITNEDGEYAFTVEESNIDSIVLVVDGFDHEELSHPMYASVERSDFTEGEPIDFSFTDTSVVDVGGEDVIVSNTVSEETSTVNTIANIEQLQAMNEDLGDDYKLVRDIDASGTSEWNDNKGFEPIGGLSNSFDGSLDSQGYEIEGLTINRPTEEDVGLIGINEGTVENIGVVNADITGDNLVGGLVGVNDDGTVSESYATGTVTGEGNWVGGLVGVNNNGDITESYSTGSVNSENVIGGLVGVNDDGTVSESYAEGSVTGGSEVGGLVGYNIDGEVSESYAEGSVTGGSEVGGLVGFNQGLSGDVSESYATGDVTGDTDIGGLVGVNDDGTVSESYWDTESEILEGGTDVSTDGLGINSGIVDNIEGLETIEMQSSEAESNMSGFDFTNTWSTSDDYPILEWQE